jgi:hypothetical protein
VFLAYRVNVQHILYIPLRHGIDHHRRDAQDRSCAGALDPLDVFPFKDD